MSKIYSVPSMPSTASVLSAYTTFAASAMLVKTVLNEVQTIASQLIPQKLQEKIISNLGGLFGNASSEMTLIINEYNGFTTNEIYQASQLYLSTRINPSIGQLKVSKGPQEETITVSINKGQKIVDTFEEMQLVWEFVSTETQKTVVDIESFSQSAEKTEHKSVLLSFHKKYKDKVLSAYLPFVLKRSKDINDENKVVKLHALGSGYSGAWGSINFDHPSTFDTLAMDPVLKQELIDDLDKFVKRRDFYRRVGKAWKRGYLLYGPPGTGKSSLIAAMANYLKFDVYDLELTSLQTDSQLRILLTGTSNRSIIVIEDIDCSVELQNRQCGGYNGSDSELSLSGLLNVIDGLWSSCGDERIIVFTTNYKDRLDPALLRPGRMDMHIHMSYCTPSGFKILAFNYLNIKTHSLFTEIEQLITQVQVTPADVAEQFMRSGDDVDAALKGLIGFLLEKKEMKSKEAQVKEDKEVTEEKDNEETEEKCPKKRVQKNKRNARGKVSRRRLI